MDAPVTPLKKRDVGKLRPTERRDLLLELEALVRSGQLHLGEAVRLLRSVLLGMDRETFARAAKLSPRALANLEDRRDSNPRLSTLTRALAPFGARVVIAFPNLQPEEPAGEEAGRRRSTLLATAAKSRRRKKR